MSRISQIEACNPLYSYDFIYISETYFELSILEGVFYKMNTTLSAQIIQVIFKEGGVCIYHNKPLGVGLVKSSDLCQCIVCEVI